MISKHRKSGDRAVPRLANSARFAQRHRSRSRLRFIFLLCPRHIHLAPALWVARWPRRRQRRHRTTPSTGTSERTIPSSHLFPRQIHLYQKPPAHVPSHLIGDICILVPGLHHPPQPVWPWASSAVRDKQEMGRVLGQGGRGAETTKSRDERATGSGGEARQGNHFGGRDDKGNQKTRSKNTLDKTEWTERPPSLRKTRVCKANRLNAFWEL